MGDSDDYNSTARALHAGTHISPSDFASSPEQPPLGRFPSWHRRNTSYGGTSLHGSTHHPQTYKEYILQSAEKLQRQYISVYRRLTLLQRILLVIAGIIGVVGGILFLIFNERIFAWFAPVAEKWRDITGGWMILWAATFVVAFPPLIGYSSCLTLAGFVYGFPTGWFIVAPATVVGSTASFIISRTVLASYVERLVANDKRFTAFALTLKHDGLKLLLMIRLCPLPYSLSNGAIATFPTVTWLNFAIATALVSPKLLIHVFVGSRLGELAKHGGEMDAKAKAVNWLSIIFGIIVGIATGVIIYRQTKARAAQLEEEERMGMPPGGVGGDGEAVLSPGEYVDDPEHALRAPDEFSLHDAAMDGGESGLGRGRDAMYSDEFADDLDDDADAFGLDEEDEVR